MKRFCMMPDCNAVMTGDHLLCVKHWKKLGKKTRDQVQLRINGWKSLNAARIYLREVLFPSTSTHGATN